jgi:hypothetical protein
VGLFEIGIGLNACNKGAETIKEQAKLTKMEEGKKKESFVA